MKNKIRLLRLVLCWSFTTTAIAVWLTGCVGDRYTRSTGQYIDDQALRGRVHSALSDDPVYKFNVVTVTAFKGTVQLGGFVFTGDQRARAGEITRRVYGVIEVVNNIIVREHDRRAWEDNRRTTNNPPVNYDRRDRRVNDNYPPPGNPDRTVGEYVDDKTLAARVKSALSRDEVKLGEVKVTTYDRTVQLSGFVNTPEQKNRAGEIARQVPGVKEVSNNITVK